ncbi:unnamed protein product [Amoebophrya sp. A120]|nr:unnamed protein product [Amoebophrya sp. A120]|eukprot:GSA120T00005447001.1
MPEPRCRRGICMLGKAATVTTLVLADKSGVVTGRARGGGSSGIHDAAEWDASVAEQNRRNAPSSSSTSNKAHTDADREKVAGTQGGGRQFAGRAVPEDQSPRKAAREPASTRSVGTLVVGADQQIQDKKRQRRQLQPELYCAVAGDKLSMNDKLCLQSCHVINDEIQPRFYQWEDYCKDTSLDSDWDQWCYDYYDCLLGCEVFQEITDMGTVAIWAKRKDLLKQMDPSSILDGDQKCAAEQCRSYCTRQTLPTCRELAFKAECEAMQRSQRLMRCDMDCSSAFSARDSVNAWFTGLLLAVALIFY